jgi:recombination protein RecA
MISEKDEKKRPFEPPKNRDPKSISEAINKYFKSNISGFATDEQHIASGTKYSTGILSLDRYLGIGGILGGRIMDIYGWEGTGKTLTSLTVAASIQRQGGKAAFLDAEGTFSKSLAEAVGVNVDELIIIESTPERVLTGEDYFNAASMLVQSGVEFIIIDSVPALIPSSRLLATVGQGQKAALASMMSEGLSQLTSLITANKRSVIWFINQMRSKPMVMFGSPDDSTGGNALKFYASYRLMVRKVEDIVKKVPSANGEYEPKIIGVTVKATLQKNKTAVIPHEPITFDVYFENVTDEDGMTYSAGVDVYKDIMEVGIASGIIRQESSWFYYENIKGNGRRAFMDALRAAPPSIIQEIRDRVLSMK